MENSQLKDLQEEVSEATKQYILTTFNSENGMKTYYLQMSNIIRSAHINPPIDTEYNSLKKLSKKLKQYCTFIQTLGEHEWDKGIADIQKALVKNANKQTRKLPLNCNSSFFSPGIQISSSNFMEYCNAIYPM